MHQQLLSLPACAVVYELQVRPVVVIVHTVATKTQPQTRVDGQLTAIKLAAASPTSQHCDTAHAQSRTTCWIALEIA